MKGGKANQTKEYPRNVNSLLVSGEDILISDAHIIKYGTPGIA